MKNIFFIKVTAMLTIALFFVCTAPKANAQATNQDEEKIEESSATNVTPGKINDTMLVEYVAQITYITEKFEKEMENKTTEEIVKLSEKMVKDMANVLEKLGITEDEITAYSEKKDEDFENNPALALKFTEQLVKRVAELHEEGK